MNRLLPPPPQGGVTLTARLAEAVGYALEVHGGQVRKGTPIPYVSHLLAVAALVLESGGYEDEAVAALLHDAVEDGGGKPRADDICGRFGPRVARIVLACSDSDVVDPSQKRPWRERKEQYRGKPAVRDAWEELGDVAACAARFDVSPTAIQWRLFSLGLVSEVPCR